MKKNKKMVGCPVKELLKTMKALAGSAKLRKEVEDYFKSQGSDIKIDEFGLGHLYTPLYVTSTQTGTSKIFKKIKKESNNKKN